MKIVVLDSVPLSIGDISYDVLSEFGELSVFESSTKEEALERIEDAEIVFTNKVPLGKDEFERAKKLEYVGVLATGYNIIDLEEARRHSVVVTNTPSYGTRSVAEFAFSLLLELCHRVQRHSDEVLSGGWQRRGSWCFWDTPQISLDGKTLGIIGYGQIGEKSGEIGKAFGMKVIAYDATPREGADFVSLDELFASSDIIFLHCPLTKETEEIINRESISKMKDGVIIINNARGQLIDDEALAEALQSGKVQGAALDVVSTEPIKSGNPLLNAPNIIITPHISWASYESRKRLFDIAVDNLRKHLEGKAQNIVT